MVEFLVAQAAKHQVSDKVLSKDLLQMGVAIENANAIVKAVVENVESMARTLRDNTLRVS